MNSCDRIESALVNKSLLFDGDDYEDELRSIAKSMVGRCRSLPSRWSICTRASDWPEASLIFYAPLSAFDLAQIKQNGVKYDHSTLRSCSAANISLIWSNHERYHSQSL